MNVVLYLRYSSDKQTEQSIEGQRRVCEDFCKHNDFTIVGEYVDRATSAYHDSDKRPEFQRMIKDSSKLQWDGVVVYKLDRFARNRYVSATYKVQLKKYGVRVISATENISDSPEGVILESVLEGMAEFYSMELSQKIQRGMHESALKCNSTGGAIPLGYKIVNKKMVVDEPNAEIVREAFSMYADGCSITEIVEKFNQKGYRTAKGVPFNKNSFHAMFKNERYKGIYKYKDIRVENGIPAIIDADTFETVSRRMRSAARAPAHAKAKVEYLLTQKIFCGHCGSSMVGESGKGKNGTVYHYYTCANRKKHGSCRKKPLQKEYIERLVVENALELLTPERIEELADMAFELNKKENDKNGLVSGLEKEVRQIENGINNLLKLVEKGIVSDSVTERISELEKDKKTAEARLVDAKRDTILLSRDLVIYWLTSFTIGDIKSETFRRKIIDTFINSVTVWDVPEGGYRITTMYNLSSENTRTVTVDPDGLCSDFVGNGSPKHLLFGGCFFLLTKGEDR